MDMLSSAAALGAPWKFALVCPEQSRRALYADRQFLAAQRGAQRNLLHGSDSGADFGSAEQRVLRIHQRFKVPEAMLYQYHCCTRAYGLTMRFPYLDRHFTTCIWALPRHLRGKGAIRRLAALYMPAEAAQSPKIAQTIPLGHWFKGPLEAFLRDQLSEGRIRNSGFFDPGEVTKVINDHVSGRYNHTWKLWSLVTILAWQSLASRGDW